MSPKLTSARSLDRLAPCAGANVAAAGTVTSKRDPVVVRTGRPRRLGAWAALATIALVLWFLLVGKLGAGELLLGLIAASLAATATSLVIAEERLHFRLEARDVAQIVTIPRELFVDTWGVFVILARHLFAGQKAHSLVIERPFDIGLEDDPHAAARRALAVAYVTATPRAVVLGFDAERGTVSYHLLAPGPVPPVLERLTPRGADSP